MTHFVYYLTQNVLHSHLSDSNFQYPHFPVPYCCSIVQLTHMPLPQAFSRVLGRFYIARLLIEPTRLEQLLFDIFRLCCLEVTLGTKISYTVMHSFFSEF